jgi:hypothetical protein
MKNIDIKFIFHRFETPEQRRIRETLLHAWYIERVLEDRAETAVPPPELLEPGHG